LCPSAAPLTLRVLSVSDRDQELLCNAYHESETLPTVPNNLKDVPRPPDASKWKSLIENNTREDAPRQNVPSHRKVLSSRVVFKYRLGPDGSIVRYKARFVARGYEQANGVEFLETCTSVVKPVSYRAMFALYGWICRQMDVKTAFLYGELDGEVYPEPPTGILPEDTVLRLNKSLYELKQSPRRWYKKLRGVPETLVWTVSLYDEPVFTHSKDIMFLTAYVHDLNIYAPTEELAEPVRNALKKQFKMTDIGECAFYLGMYIDRQRNGTTHLHQGAFIRQILPRFDMVNGKTVTTLLTSDTKLTASKVNMNSHKSRQLYQVIVSSINYLAVTTRPNISLAVSLNLRYCAHPSNEHMEAV
jgi:hypothetical protein